MRDAWRQIAGTSGAKMYSLAVGLAVLVLSARVLGPEGRGLIASATTWVLLFGTLGHLSLGQVALTVATREKGTSWLPATLGALLAWGAIVTAAGWAVAAGLFAATGGSVFGDVPAGLLALAFLALPAHVWENYGSSVLTALHRIGVYNVAQVVGRTATLALAAGLLWAGWGAAGVLVALLASQAIVAAAGMRTVFREAGGVRLDGGSLRALVAGGAKLHLSTIGTYVVTSIGTVVVAYHRGLEEAAFYNLAVQLMAVALVVPQSASRVMYSAIVRLGPDEAWRRQRVLLVQITALLAVGAVVAAALAPWGVPWVVGAAFKPAVPVVQLLMLALVARGFGVVMASQWISRGHFGAVSAITGVTAALNVAAYLALVPRWGMEGAAWAVVGVSLLATVPHAAFAVRLNRRAAAGA